MSKGKHDECDDWLVDFAFRASERVSRLLLSIPAIRDSQLEGLMVALSGSERKDEGEDAEEGRCEEEGTEAHKNDEDLEH